LETRAVAGRLTEDHLDLEGRLDGHTTAAIEGSRERLGERIVGKAILFKCE